MLGAVPGAQRLLLGTNFFVGLALAIVLFPLMFRILSKAELSWPEILSGAILCGVLFTFGKSAIGFVIGKTGAVTAYGAYASVMKILLWVYCSSQILLLGAEFARPSDDSIQGGFAMRGKQRIRIRPGARNSYLSSTFRPKPGECR